MLDRDTRRPIRNSLDRSGAWRRRRAPEDAGHPKEVARPAEVALFFPVKSDASVPSRETKDLIVKSALAAGPSGAPRVEAKGYAIKRLTDILGSLALLVLFGPLMIIVAALVACFNGWPIVFAQERIGLGGKTFRIYKFRSMSTDANRALAQVLAHDVELSQEWSQSQKLLRDPRVTGLGRLLRLSSVDELPQLFNVLKGDMSLVGPRPIVESEAIRYGRQFARYCAVKPGLTGLWQVCRSDKTSYQRRIALDVTYGRRVSFGLDVMILLRTVPAVLFARGH